MAQNYLFDSKKSSEITKLAIISSVYILWLKEGKRHFVGESEMEDILSLSKILKDGANYISNGNHPEVNLSFRDTILQRAGYSETSEKVLGDLSSKLEKILKQPPETLEEILAFCKSLAEVGFKWNETYNLQKPNSYRR